MVVIVDNPSLPFVGAIGVVQSKAGRRALSTS
jgi:hypothetical protein